MCVCVRLCIRLHRQNYYIEEPSSNNEPEPQESDQYIPDNVEMMASHLQPVLHPGSVPTMALARDACSHLLPPCTIMSPPTFVWSENMEVETSSRQSQPHNMTT